MKHSRSAHVLVVALLITGTSVFAQPGGMQRPPRDGQRPDGPPQHEMDKRPEIPGLTDQQNDQMKKLHEAFAEKSLPIQNQLGEKEAHLRTLTTVKKVDENEVNKVVDEIGSLRHQLFKSHVMLDLKIRELLTDEQRVFFDSHPRPQGPPPMQ